MDPRCEKILGTVRDAGYPVEPGATVLDLGCGNGDLVQLFAEYGYDAFGCDMRFKPGNHADALAGCGRLRTIAMAPYRLPFADDQFDLLCSTQVLEHVKDYRETLLEIRRVLRPGGIALHQFPSRWRPVETHVFVPFSSSYQRHWWLYLWAMLGIRKPDQRGMTAKEVADDNYHYLNENTNYLTRSQITGHLDSVYETHQYCELELIKYTRLRPMHALLKAVPGFGWVIGEFHSRAILTAKPVEGNG